MKNVVKENWWGLRSCYHALAAFVVPLFIFVSTAPRTVTFEDSGLFILSGYYWGVPHPPGYPLYTLLAHIFSYLPLSNIAFSISLLSCLLGGLSSFILFKILSRIFINKNLALLASLTTFLSSTIWSQMIVAEVYALNVFLCLSFFYVCLVVRESPKRKKIFFLGLIGGLALSNHWPIFILTAPSFILLSKKEWYNLKNILSFVGGISLFVFFYLLLWWRSQQNVEIAFLGEINNISELVKYFLRSYYSSNDASVLHSVNDIWSFVFSFVKHCAYQDFFMLLLPLFILGAITFFKNKKNQNSFFVYDQLIFSRSFLYILISTTVILPFLLRLEYNVLNENIFRVFWLLPFIGYMYFVTLGAYFLNSKKHHLGTCILIAGLLGQIYPNYRANNLKTDHFAEDYGQIILSSIPEGQTLVASTDGDVGPIGYVNKILQVNSSTKLYTGTGVLFKDRIFDPLLSSANKRYKLTNEFIKNNEPVYSVKNLAVFEGQKDFSLFFNFNGITYKYTVFPTSVDPVTDDTVKKVIMALDHYVWGLHLNNWPYHRATLASRLCNILVLKNIEEHEVFKKSPECMQVLARHMAATNRREQADALFLKWYRSIIDPIAVEKQQFLFHFLVNRLEFVNSIKNNSHKQKILLDEGVRIAEEALFDYPICDNKVAPVLRSISGQVKLSDRAIAKLKDIPADCKLAKYKNI